MKTHKELGLFIVTPRQQIQLEAQRNLFSMFLISLQDLLGRAEPQRIKQSMERRRSHCVTWKKIKNRIPVTAWFHWLPAQMNSCSVIMHLCLQGIWDECCQNRGNSSADYCLHRPATSTQPQLYKWDIFTMTFIGLRTKTVKLGNSRGTQRGRSQWAIFENKHWGAKNYSKSSNPKRLMTPQWTSLDRNPY